MGQRFTGLTGLILNYPTQLTSWYWLETTQAGGEIFSMKKQFKFWSFALFALMLSGLLAACGDSTATPTVAAPAATTAAATTAAMTTAAMTTAAPTTAAMTTAAMTTAAATTAAMTTAAGTTAAMTTAAGTTAAGGGATGTGNIDLYSSLPLTGSAADQNVSLVNAMKLAIDDFTGGTGKINGYTIKYTSLDDATAAQGQWDAAKEAANANQVVADPDAMAYLGTYNSGAAKISIPIMNAAGLAMISPANTNPCLTHFDTNSGCGQTEPADYYKANPALRNYFRVVTDDDVQGPADVAFIATLGAKKVYVVDDSQSYGQGLANAFSAACKPAGLDCSGRASINGKESDYKSLAATIKNANPDAIFFGGTTQQQAPKLLSDIRSAGIRVPFMGGDGINENAFITGAGSVAEGVYSSIEGVDQTKLPPKGQDFIKNFTTKYGAPQAYTIYGYEVMSVALTAIKAAGHDRTKVIQALSAIKDFSGVTGTWSFDKNGDTTLSDYAVYQVKDGKWTFVTQTKAPAKS